MIDENSFFREATLLICGSLEIEKALKDVLAYIRQYIPADMIFLSVYNRDTGVGEDIAKADLDGGSIISVKVHLPELIRNIAEDHFKNSDGKAKITVVDKSNETIVFDFVSSFVESPNATFMFMIPVPRWNLFCSIMIGNHLGEKYNDDHMRLFSLLNEPMAIAVSNYLRYREVHRLKDILLDDNRFLQNELMLNHDEEIVGAQFGLKKVMKMVVQVAPMISPVLLQGETGTGKEVIATAIHNLSPRRERPFIKVNCGAIPESLIDSELFGHEKGAFTGAFTQKRGRFERAHGGTIFLDEIGELTPSAQVRLLRVLQEKEIERIGGAETIPVDIRVIVATHRNLKEMIDSGRFREDLYFRLCVFPIELPPLRERRDDIPVLIQHFMRKKARQMGWADEPNLSPGSMTKLMNYRWPGNVRELQNMVERALILSNGEPLRFDDPSIKENTEPATVPHVNVPDVRDFNQAVKTILTQALVKTHGRIEGDNGAAKLLNLNPSTLRTKLRKFEIPFGGNMFKA